MEHRIEEAEIHGVEHGNGQGTPQIPWSGLSLEQARDLADENHETLLPRIAGTLKARIEARERSVLDAHEPYAAVDHALLFAYEQRGRKLQALAVGELLGDLIRGAGRLAQRLVLQPLARWNERSRRIRELSRLDDRMLKDIGLTRGEINYVARFGKPPRTRAA